jgi:FAD/FMN-containing dehydrogenase
VITYINLLIGVDNAVQITVVTSNGQHLTVNRYQNSDLFWALRGGGGGTYGVITSVSYQTYPAKSFVAASFTSYINTTNITASSPVLKTLFTEFVRITPSLSDSGWAGYAEVQPSAPTNAKSLHFFYLIPNVSWAEANATIDPFFNFARSLAANSSVEDGGQLTAVSAETLPPNPFQFYETQIIRPGAPNVGTNLEIGSRLLPRTLIENDHEKVAETLLEVPIGATY